MTPRQARRIREGILRARAQVDLFEQFGIRLTDIITMSERQPERDPLTNRAHWRALHSIARARIPRWHRRTWRAA